ncbi:MAG: MFS transporter [Elusimicrobia bacterium]|nr:MFS transporter [Elusimicrobiota bacterium]
MSSARLPRSERAVLFILAAVHFVNLLDFMMVMPMGPDFAAALGIPMSRLGIVGGSYTAAATVVGVLGSLLLDRWERRRALIVSVCGLGLATMSGALATGAASLVAARLAAGSFGGIAGTICFSIVADLVPEGRRGRATAVVASGFSLASIVGVPAGLELARRGGWRAPFVVVGLLALALAAGARLSLPVLRAHLDREEAGAPLSPDARMGYTFAAFGCAILGNFLLVPNLPAYLQFNMGFPREHLGLLYCFGGLASLATMRLAGVWTDRSRALWPALAATVLVSGTLALGVLVQPPLLPPVVFFGAFMGCNAARWVAVNALASRVPPPSARARFLSAQNAFAHGASAAAAFASAAFLTVGPSGMLVGMPALALTAALLGLGVPLAVWRLEALMGHRHALPVTAATPDF